jgi:2-phospho-L-lactate guanylyltransferase (CobY/MobA/RfbA family)
VWFKFVQKNVYKTSSLETKIRNATKEAIHEIESSAENGTLCVCSRKMGGTNCKICLMREVSKRLQKAGFNSAVCKTKWRTSRDIPPGT